MDGDPRPKRKRMQFPVSQQKKRPAGVDASIAEHSPTGSLPGV